MYLFEYTQHMAFTLFLVYYKNNLNLEMIFLRILGNVAFSLWYINILYLYSAYFSFALMFSWTVNNFCLDKSKI